MASDSEFGPQTPAAALCSRAEDPPASTERVHGGIHAWEARTHGVDPASVLDLSVNINPHGPCQAVLDAARSAALEKYPDASAFSARLAWANRLRVTPSRLAVGAGAADLFWALTRALVVAGDRVVIAEPTFSELRVAATRAGATVERVFAPAESGFQIDLFELLHRARGARLVYLCTPNNPTGQGFAFEAIESFARDLGETILVLDQSFLSLSERAQDLVRRLPANVICVRSLTKDFAVPGLRIGLLVAEPRLVESVEASRPTWSTSAPAQAAIEAAAAQQSFVAEAYQRLRGQRAYQTTVLAQHGLAPLPSETVYQLVEVGQATEFRSQLLRRGVLVRDCSSFGLPGYVRIAVRSAEDSERLGRALGEIRGA